MTTKPLRIEKVKGCRVEYYFAAHSTYTHCPFFYCGPDANHCVLGGSPDGLQYPLKEGDKPYPPDCPLINANICVELEPMKDLKLELPAKLRRKIEKKLKKCLFRGTPFIRINWRERP